nr:MAG TPA: YABBY protein [Caudoviricetes sp.]DAJ58843.1 MAG TPA: YABBY protein [Caudoviricetes sp.]
MESELVISVSHRQMSELCKSHICYVQCEWTNTVFTCRELHLTSRLE